MRYLKYVSIGLLVVAGVASTASAADLATAHQAREARVVAAPGGAPLSLPSDAAPEQVVAKFFQGERQSLATVSSLVTITEQRIEATGLTHIKSGQMVSGLNVFGTYVKATLNADGELVHLIENIAKIPEEGVRPARVTAQDALQAALTHLHPGLANQTQELESYGNTVTYTPGESFFRAPNVTRVAIPVAAGMNEGFLVETWTNRANLLHYTLVDGNGLVLSTELRTNEDSYRIFPDHPGTTNQTVVSGPGAGNTESPSGWLSGSQTTVNISGNNVHAYLDRDANNSPDSGGSAVSSGDFLASANLGQAPTTATNQAVAVQNLFYFNNVIHDKLYSHGFTESAGNFQNNNFGNGGNGNDAVNAEAQDGSGTNNANFSTPNDGSPGRMQMFLWTAPNPDRDGDVDSDIIWHEYGHGLTWRMIGNMSGPMSGAIGEGMSDCLAILVNDDDTVGEYSTQDPDGIRSAPYTNYPRTYGDFTGNSVHFDGEIYAATCWRMHQIFQQNGVSQDTLFDYIVGGMNFTPSGPDMGDMRDGILQAATGSGNECLIWEAFAASGIGDGSSSRIRGQRVTITESFSLPSNCVSCTPTEPSEMSCNDGQDNDCDGLIDSADPDCGGGSCFPVGTSCTSNSQCCSNKCKGPSGGKTCK
ncbi:MAG: M36 family metallopeptidase [Deltaproteobacteria bacterium]|nr:M36 family metallopeptidase [Deltaproteobacteria bacterium]